MPPPMLTNSQLLNQVFSASAMTQVAMAKYMPRIRNRMRERISASTAPMAPPTIQPTT